jgi:diguanylate cyclase (GGDEF)-like protein
VVDDEPLVLQTLARLFARDFDVLTATTAEAAQALFGQREIDVILADQRLPGMPGVQLLEWVRQQAPKTIRLMMTGLAKPEDLIDAINCGQVHRFIFKPWKTDDLLQTLRNAARAFLLERSHEALLEELRQLNLELEQRVLQRTRELEQANQQLEQKNSMLEKLALTDPLTGLPNRRAMDRLARSELRRRARYPGPLALGIIDVDFFKEVNQKYLLPGGDQALIGLGRILTRSLRTVDHLGRIGGEEFLVVAPETDADGAHALAERIRAAVEHSAIPYKGEGIRLTVSIGVAVAGTLIAASYEHMKDVAAAALGEAKAAGRNRCVLYPLPHLLPPRA